jgi:hypothetical protein
MSTQNCSARKESTKTPQTLSTSTFLDSSSQNKRSQSNISPSCESELKKKHFKELDCEATKRHSRVMQLLEEKTHKHLIDIRCLQAKIKGYQKTISRLRNQVHGDGKHGPARMDSKEIEKLKKKFEHELTEKSRLINELQLKVNLNLSSDQPIAHNLESQIKYLTTEIRSLQSKLEESHLENESLKISLKKMQFQLQRRTENLLNLIESHAKLRASSTVSVLPPTQPNIRRVEYESKSKELLIQRPTIPVSMLEQTHEDKSTYGNSLISGEYVCIVVSYKKENSLSLVGTSLLMLLITAIPIFSS